MYQSKNTRELTTTELDAVAGGNVVVLPAALVIAMAEKAAADQKLAEEIANNPNTFY